MIVNRSAHLTNVLIEALFTTFILVIWRVCDRPAGAIQGMFNFGFMVGSPKITPGLLFTSAAVLYRSFLTSWAVQIMLMKGVFSSRGLQVDVRISIGRLIHYGFVWMGVLMALVALGVHLRYITIVAGALGVGIGLGLQGIARSGHVGWVAARSDPSRLSPVGFPGQVHSYLVFVEMNVFFVYQQLPQVI